MKGTALTKEASAAGKNLAKVDRFLGFVWESFDTTTMYSCFVWTMQSSSSKRIMDLEDQKADWRLLQKLCEQLTIAVLE